MDDLREIALMTSREFASYLSAHETNRVAFCREHHPKFGISRSSLQIILRNLEQGHAYTYLPKGNGQNGPRHSRSSPKERKIRLKRLAVLYETLGLESDNELVEKVAERWPEFNDYYSQAK